MEKTVYVFGHQNPDTDSVCASISYSYLKNQIDKQLTYVPIILKEVNKETAYVLQRFNVTPPQIIQHLKPQVSDIHLSDYRCVKESDSIRKILETIWEIKSRTLPVVDQDERLIGIISLSDILPMILSTSHSNILKNFKTPFINLINELNLKIASYHHLDLYQKLKDNPYYSVKGQVFISTDLPLDKHSVDLTLNDIVVCNLTEWTNYCHLVGGIIVAGIKDSATANKLANDFDTYCDCHPSQPPAPLYHSSLSVFELIKGLVQTMPVASLVTKKGLEYFVTYETIDDVSKNLASSRFKTFPVVDECGQVQGLLSRSDLMGLHKKKAILVDHNERGQSIEGIEDIDILEIIDHHRVADITTISPLYFRVEPVGCTCTIITDMYEEKNIPIPSEIAGLMLSAIISDTLLFHSPTCTERDRQAATKLANICGISPEYYGMKMIAKGSEIRNKKPHELLNIDRKKFMFGRYKVTIAQINSGDFDSFYHIYDAIVEQMNHFCQTEHFDLFVLLITDVVIGGTEIIATGQARWIVENAFDLRSNDKSKFLVDVFSRKKQIVPKLMNAAKL